MRKFYNKLKESENYNVIILAVLVALVLKLLHYVLVTAVNLHHIIVLNLTEDIEFYTGTGSLLSVIFISLAIAFVVQACRRDPNFMICAIVSLTVVAVAGVSLCAVQCIIACGYWLWMAKKPSAKSEFARIRGLTITMICVSFATFMAWELSVWIPFGFETLKDEVLFALQWAFGNCLNPEILLIAYLCKNSKRKLFKNICMVLAAAWIVVAIGAIISAGMLMFGGLGHFDEWGPENGESNYDSKEAGDWSGWSTLDEDGNLVRMEEDENGNITYYDEEGNGSATQVFEFD